MRTIQIANDSATIQVGVEGAYVRLHRESGRGGYYFNDELTPEAAEDFARALVASAELARAIAVEDCTNCNHTGHEPGYGPNHRCRTCWGRTRTEIVAAILPRVMEATRARGGILAQALRDVLVRAGVIKGDASMAGPELLAVAQSYVDGSVAPARTTPSVIYKLRAECWVDAARLLLRLCPDRAEVVHLELGEVQVLLENPSNRRDDGRRGRPLSLEELRYTIRESVPDSHVMIETLRTADEYTGERTYGKEAR